MTYQQAGRVAIFKRISGWVVFIPALLSTAISVMGFMLKHSEKQPGIDAVVLDFIHVMIDMVKTNTPFLHFFWQNSPIPVFEAGKDIAFWLIYALLFIGVALQASGVRMWRQSRYIKEGIEDQLLLEQAKGSAGMNREQLEAKINVPNHTIFRQFFSLYILPFLIIAAGYFLFRLFGFI